MDRAPYQKQFGKKRSEKISQCVGQRRRESQTLESKSTDVNVHIFAKFDLRKRNKTLSFAVAAQDPMKQAKKA